MKQLKDADIRKIYSRLADTETKEIFANRLLYSLTGDTQYIKKVICTTLEGNEFCRKLQECSKKKVIFGAGIWGREIVNTYKDIKFECFIDNKITSQSQFYHGIPIISFGQYLREYKEEIVIIATRLYYAEIYQQLIENGVKKENIVNAGKMIDDMSKRQYFDLPEISEHLGEGSESFIDAGSFDGRTSILFAERCHGNYDHIWAFEPDKKNLERCIKALKNLGKNCEVIPKGLWDEEIELGFSSVSNGGSKVCESGDEIIHAGRMDDMIHGKVSFIKMDIEGAEYKALRGCRTIIQRNKPKLAISIYHKPEDIWEIPLLICEMNPEYKLYLRHYSTAAAETVIYAI